MMRTRVETAHRRAEVADMVNVDDVWLTVSQQIGECPIDLGVPVAVPERRVVDDPKSNTTVSGVGLVHEIARRPEWVSAVRILLSHCQGITLNDKQLNPRNIESLN